MDALNSTVMSNNSKETIEVINSNFGTSAVKAIQKQPKNFIKINRENASKSKGKIYYYKLDTSRSKSRESSEISSNSSRIDRNI